MHLKKVYTCLPEKTCRSISNSVFGPVLTRSVMQENEVNLLQEAASWLLQLQLLSKTLKNSPTGLEVNAFVAVWVYALELYSLKPTTIAMQRSSLDFQEEGCVMTNSTDSTDFSTNKDLCTASPGGPGPEPASCKRWTKPRKYCRRGANSLECHDTLKTYFGMGLAVPVSMSVTAMSMSVSDTGVSLRPSSF